MELSEVWRWVVGLFAALVGAGVVLKVVIKKRHSQTTSVRITSQKGNRAGGDIIGGDSVKKSVK